MKVDQVHGILTLTIGEVTKLAAGEELIAHIRLPETIGDHGIMLRLERIPVMHSLATSGLMSFEGRNREQADDQFGGPRPKFQSLDGSPRPEDVRRPAPQPPAPPAKRRLSDGLPVGSPPEPTTIEKGGVPEGLREFSDRFIKSGDEQ